MIQKIFIIHNADIESSKVLRDLVEHIKIHYKIKAEFLHYKTAISGANASTLCLIYLNENEIKEFFKNNLNTEVKIAFLPHKDSIKVLTSYGIAKDIHEALENAMDEDSYHRVDLLSCNGEVVFSSVVLGDVHGLNHQIHKRQNLFTQLKEFYMNLVNLNFKDYTLTTSKGQVIQTAATGIMVLEHNSQASKNNAINENISLHDGKLHAFILSPTSIFSYIYFLFLVSFYSKLNPNTLPKTLGSIQTSKLLIESSKAIDFIVDGTLMSAKAVDLEIYHDALKLSLGKITLHNLQNVNKSSLDKEFIKTKHLPKGEVKNLLLHESVPLFKKADENDFKELFLALKESAKPSSIFIVLMVLSTLLATTGLFQNSAPVIIGAMILAPLMSPIISLSMGVVRGESFLISNSVKTLLLGILTALLFSCVYTYIMPLNVLTDEMRGRLNPTILDLMVAIISGIAGAYANAKSEIAKSLAGVAIAVALVPPLSVTGIGLGWGDFSVTYSSFLLFLTNLVGITLAASLTFLVLGYAPIHRAKKGIFYTFWILFVVSIPLVISFNKAISQNNIIAELNNHLFNTNNKTINIHILDVDLSHEKPHIYLQTNSHDLLNEADLKSLKEKITSILEQEVQLNISTNTVVE